MNKYNFDEIVERKETNSLKFDALQDRFGSNDLIPLWVADMDFKCPNEIIEAVTNVANQGLYGYPSIPSSFKTSIANWVKKQHQWNVNEAWIDFVPGVVKGISFALDCFISEGEKIIIQPPVYPPFREVPNMHGLKIVENPLILKDGRFKMDIEGLKEAISPACRILILCNPHNPGGTIWTKEELEAIAEICYEEGILVVSDEIHCDLALCNHEHIPFASVSEKAAQNSITLMAPSKTFNIAGIVSSFVIIPNDLLREKYNKYLTTRELNSPHIFVQPATEAAFNYGEDWLKEMKEYIWENITFVDEYLEKNIPQVKAMIPEASFLIWLDCRDLNLSQEDLVDLFVKDAHLALNNGISFGKQGEGFMRLNIGTQCSVLELALKNLKKAIEAKQL